MNTATLFKRSERSEVMINFNFKFKNKYLGKLGRQFMNTKRLQNDPET